MLLLQATGWIGFGVSENKGNMQGYDVMVGGVNTSLLVSEVKLV